MRQINSISEQRKNDTDSILDKLLDAVLIVDDGGLIIYANRSAFRLFEKEPAELLNHSFGFSIVQYEVQEINVLKGGELLTVQMLTSSIVWNDKNASLLSLRDITAQKKLNYELEVQSILLQNTSEENAQYASLASHDLKEPVRKILMYTDLLLQTDGRPSDDQEKIKKIRLSATRMNLLINGIAELSRISYVDHYFEQIDLSKIVNEVCDDLQLQLRDKDGAVELSHLPVIYATPHKMYRLFLNLISNSLKYTRDNVKPFIRISSHVLDDDYVQITLQDNGMGFDNSFAPQLFHPFRRLHKTSHEGIGIGLSLCQRIVEIHGGKIFAEGVEGQGAAFHIILPFHHHQNHL